MSNALTKRLKIGPSRKKPRLAVKQAQQRLDETGRPVMPPDDVNVWRGRLTDAMGELNVKKAPQPHKQKAIGDAAKTIEDMNAAIKKVGDIKQPLINKFQKDYQKSFETCFATLKSDVNNAVPGSDYVPAEQREMENNISDFFIAMRTAPDLEAAQDIFDKKWLKHQEIETRAKRLRSTDIVLTATQKRQAEALFVELDKQVTALEIANAPGADAMSKLLFAGRGKADRGDFAGSLDDLTKLGQRIATVSNNNLQEANRALENPRLRLGGLRSALEKFQKGPEGKLDSVKPVLKTIGLRLDTLAMFLDGNLTPESAVSAEAMADAIEKMLEEVRGTDATKDKEEKLKIANAKKMLEDTSFVFFRGKGAESKEYFPKEFNELLARQQNLSKTVEGMGVSERATAIKDYADAAGALVIKATDMGTKMTGWKTKRDTFEKQEKAMNKLLKAAAKTDPTLKGDMIGEFPALLKQFKSSLGAKPPVATTLEKQAGDLATLLTKLVGTGNAPDAGKVVDAHKAGIKARDDLALLKTGFETKCTEAEKALTKVENAVKSAKPGDQLALKEITRRIKDGKKQGRTAADEDGIKLAVERLQAAIDEAGRLERAPQGDAPTRRSKLAGIDTRWNNAANAITTALENAASTIADADNLQPPAKQELGKLLTAAKARFKPGAFNTVIATMTTDPTNENLPQRLVAREEGLRLVRQFRDAIGKDPVIASLVTEKPFSIQPFKDAHQALNDLDLNISRCI